MNKKILTTLALVAMTTLARAQINPVPGGDYNPSDSNYGDIVANTFTWGGGYNAQFLTSGGNNPAGTYLSFQYVPGQASWSGGNSTIGNTTPIPLTTLGLSAGGNCTFFVDIKVESGTGVGGFYVEYWNAGGKISGTGTLYPSSETTNWVTYTFPVTIPAGTTGLKIGVQAPDYSTATTADFDNIRVVAGTATLVPGGGYETSDPTHSEIMANSYNWGGGFTDDFPTSGGNPDGYLRFTYVPGGASWSGANSTIGNVTPVPLTDLGLSAGVSCTFLADMKIESGASIGGLYVECWNAGGKIGGTGTMFPSSGTTNWATYGFPVTIPAGTTGLKIGCQAPDYSTASTVSFDNIRVASATVPLSVQFTSPTNGATAYTTLTISASASVQPASVASVSFYDGATLLGSVGSAPFTLTVTGVPTGPAALTAVAQDSNGNFATSSVVNVTITTPTASAQITSPANGATLFTNFTIYASASVTAGSITNVEFYDGATLLGNDTNAPFALTIIGAAPGSAALTAVAYADSGSTATSSVVNVTIGSTPSQTVVGVNPSDLWQGYMNVYETPQNYGGYDWGSGWGIDGLSAQFSVTGPATTLTLRPAIIGDTASYWYDYTDPSYPVGTNGAVGFKDMDATLSVELPNGMGGANGNLVTFSGTVISNTLVTPSSTNLIGNGWTSVAFIHDFAPDYSSFVGVTNVLTNGAPFSISLLTNPDPNRHIQYGFETRGPDVWPTDVNHYGSVVIQSASASTTNVYVNSAATWSGFMNVYETPQNGGGYLWGSGWGIPDLQAAFNSYGLVLSPNHQGDTDPTNTYWYLPAPGPGATGNKIMEASMYVPAGSIPGMNVVFSGNVLSNTLVSASNTNAAGNGWTCVAYIRDFEPNYSSFREVAVPLTNGLFSVSMVTLGDPARHIEYGFHTKGPDVWVTDVAPFGNVIIQDAIVLTPTITPSLSGGNVNLSFLTQLGHNYTVQYKNNLTDAPWSTLTVTNGTGVNAVVPDSTGNGHRFYRLSVQ